MLSLKCKKRRKKTKLLEIGWLRKWKLKEYGISEVRWMKESLLLY
jgi:hypothetical protein